MIDKLLGGRYRIITTLGSGGFSQTYVAEDTHRPGNPKCAVKHLQPANSNQSFLESARRLFNSEAETLEKLGHHDRIPRLLAYFEENQEFYLVQEYVQGQLLTQKIQPHQHWTEYQAWKFLKEILEILVFIHAQGFIHRDIKPSNIIERQQDNKLVLVDFGAVKQNWTLLLSQTSNVEMPATVGIGTPGYMPMEQARGRPRPSSDIYALGAIAVQALTGLYPIELEEDFETGELLWRHLAQVSDPIAVIITKMVRYHFKDRYESATEALAEIQQLAPLYLPTQINVNSAPIQPISNQNTSSTGITTPIIPASQKASSNLAALSTHNLPAPKTTIISSPKLQAIASKRRRPYYLTIGATIGAVLAASYATYWQPRIKIEQTLKQLENLKATGKYSECIFRAGTITSNSSLYTNTQNVLQECKLMEAKRLAAKGDFKAAIALVSSLPQGTNAYEQAKPLINQWNNNILALATDKYQAGKLNEAIALAQDISSASLIYPKAQASIKQWQSAAKNNSYAAVVVNSAPTRTKPTTTVAANKVVKRSPSTYTTAPKPRIYPKRASAPVKRVVSKSRIATSVASKRSASRSSAPVRRVVSKSKVVTRVANKRPISRTFNSRKYVRVSKKVAVSRVKVPQKRLVSISKTVTGVARSRPISRSSNRKYLRVNKRVAVNTQINKRTTRVFKHVTIKSKRSVRRPGSYRWTTKTVR